MYWGFNGVFFIFWYFLEHLTVYLPVCEQECLPAALPMTIVTEVTVTVSQTTPM